MERYDIVIIGTGPAAVGGDYREGKEQKDFVGRVKGFKPES